MITFSVIAKGVMSLMLIIGFSKGLDSLMDYWALDRKRKEQRSQEAD
ncbi:hypothetical protein [Ammoniphilus sp. 3BR4]